MKIGKVTFCLSLVGLVLVPSVVDAASVKALKDAGPFTVIGNTLTEAQQAGCQIVPVSKEEDLVFIPDEHVPTVVPNNSEQLLLCPTSALAQLEVQGQVAGWKGATAGAWVGGSIGTAIGGPIGTGIGAVIGGIAGWFIGDAIEQEVIDAILWGIKQLIFYLAYFVALVSNELLHIAVAIVALLLRAQKFITNPFVTLGWPFVLGIANLGFLFALIFIAGASVLRLEIGGGVRRLLPRLLIAAILINFSLIVGGLIIDATRVVSAIVAGAIGSDLDKLGVEILESSTIAQATLGNVEDADSEALTYKESSSVSQMVITAILIVGLTIAFITLLVGLFTRYIFLVLLLIVSPLAYLALALPGAQNLARKWWENFFKYAIYPVVVLFVLLIVTRLLSVGDTAQEFFGTSGSEIEGEWFGFAVDMLKYSVVVVFLFVAANAGKFMGIAGATAAVGFFGSQGKKLRDKGYAAAKKTAYVGSGARFAVRNARDFRGKVADSARKGSFGKVAKFIAGPARDEKGKLKKDASSLGSRFGTFATPDERKQAKAAKALGTINARNIGDDAIKPMLLRKTHVKKALGKKNVIEKMAPIADSDQLQAIVRDKKFIKDLDDNERVKLQVNIRNNRRITPPEQGKALSKLLDTLDKLENPSDKE